MKVYEVKNDYVKALEVAKTPKSKKAYQIALSYLDYLNDNLEVNPRYTPNGALNIGDIGEIIGKMAYYSSKNINKRVVNRSLQGNNDIERYHKSEWKTFTVDNRPSNGLSSRKGFTALLPDGVVWISYEIAKSYIKLNERIKLSVVKRMINDNELQVTPLNELLSAHWKIKALKGFFYAL